MMGAEGVRKVDLDELLELSDVISIHTGLNDATRGLVGKDELIKMKPTSYIINTARAEIIDKEALFEVLKRKDIAGAALDVFWDEPPDPEDPILHLDNITVTAHMAGSTVDALSKSMRKLCGRLKPFLQKIE